MKAPGWTTHARERGRITPLMGQNTLDSGRTENSMERAASLGQMVRSTKASIDMGRSAASGSLPGPMEIGM
jgi:hypothetical protein